MASRLVLARAATMATQRMLSSPAQPQPFSSARVEELFAKIAALPKEEVGLIGPVLSEKLGIPIPDPSTAAAAPLEEEEARAEEVVEEKTAFDLKLVGFDAKAKIKVIKEVRAIAGLGLKEAKELVEGAPKVVKKDIKKEEAEELQKKLEAVGATIEVV